MDDDNVTGARAASESTAFTPPTAPGRIILLNGTSSSGKSSIADELLPLLDGPHFRMSIDSFYGMWTAGRAEPQDTTPFEVRLARAQAGFHRAVAGMAQAGNHLVVDQVLSRPWRLPDCLSVMAGYDVTFVGVHCPPEELERRERARGDRELGQAARQLPVVHAHRTYDVDCDTGVGSPRDCAEQIKDHLSRPPSSPTAFDRLRQAGWNVDSYRQLTV